MPEVVGEAQGRPKSSTSRIQVTVTSSVDRVLEWLVSEEMYGASKSEVVNYIVQNWIHREQKKKNLPSPKKFSKSFSNKGQIEWD